MTQLQICVNYMDCNSPSLINEVWFDFQEREFLTLVTVSSIPPLTCYGSGKTVEASREEAANNALKPLLQMGLDRSSALKSLEESQGETSYSCNIERSWKGDCGFVLEQLL